MEFSSVDIAGMTSEIFNELQGTAPARRLRLDIGTLPQVWGERYMRHQVVAISHRAMISSNSVHLNRDLGCYVAYALMQKLLNGAGMKILKISGLNLAERTAQEKNTNFIFLLA